MVLHHNEHNFTYEVIQFNLNNHLLLIKQFS